MATAKHEADPPRDPGDAVAALVARAAAGEPDAWRDLVAGYARRVYALVRARVGDADIAEEVTQSVFITLAEHINTGRYREEGRFEAWLFRLAMNRLRDERRATKRRGAMLERAGSEFDARTRSRAENDDGYGAGVGAGGDGSARASGAALHAALERLNDADREVIALRHHAGLEFRAIAATLGEPLGTVLARHHRALRKLRVLLEQNDGQADE